MEVQDNAFCFEVARRSVGRAALHLGLDSMSEASLDVLADVLLQYLHRVGRSLSHLVESSGRTSAHANFLDVLQACELVTSPAVQRLHLPNPDQDDALSLFATSATAHPSEIKNNNSSNGNSLKTLNSPNWRGLATFCFGANWREEDDSAPNDRRNDSPERANNNASGGKRGPSSTDATGKQQNKSKGGWDAPYLDEVQHFPQASESCANPHPLPSHVGLSLHRVLLQEASATNKSLESFEEENQGLVPDGVFAAAPAPTRKRKVDEDGDVSMTDAGTPKKVKLSLPDKNEVDEENGRASELVLPSLVPSFYPDLPTHQQLYGSERRQIMVDLDSYSVAQSAAMDSTSSTSINQSMHQVRSSLIELGKHGSSYWGSGWEEQQSTTTSKTIRVPTGRTGSVEVSNAIVPLKRPSGSRVSRILEGSLDAANIL